MDMIKLGAFLAALRKEQGLTQEQLAQQLGTTSKTISRWETGAYMPPVEMLALLSQRYGLTINELLEGERIAPEDKPARADKTIQTFLLKEQQEYWRRKWWLDHRGWLVAAIVLFTGLQVAAVLMDNGRLAAAGVFLTLGWTILMNNRREEYVEHHLYDEKPLQG